jgi:hypothetical protein
MFVVVSVQIFAFKGGFGHKLKTNFNHATTSHVIAAYFKPMAM